MKPGIQPEAEESFVEYVATRKQTRNGYQVIKVMLTSIKTTSNRRKNSRNYLPDRRKAASSPANYAEQSSRGASFRILDRRKTPNRLKPTRGQR
ncbi:hypothetical protein ACFX2I_011282 [Malus domestica]